MNTVSLAHSHPAIRAWMRDALARTSDAAFVAEVSTGEEALSLAEQICWDLALISCVLPGKPHGIEVVERVLATEPNVPVLVLGVPDDDETLCRLWRAGAAGCIREDAAPEATARAVQAAADGTQLWASDHVARAHRWWEEVGCKLEALTEREREVLLLVTKGLSNKQIATRFSLSVNTVRAHMRSILSKLEASSRLEAATFLAKEASINQDAARDRPSGRRQASH